MIRRVVKHIKKSYDMKWSEHILIMMRFDSSLQKIPLYQNAISPLRWGGFFIIFFLRNDDIFPPIIIINGLIMLTTTFTNTHTREFFLLLLYFFWNLHRAMEELVSTNKYIFNKNLWLNNAIVYLVTIFFSFFFRFNNTKGEFLVLRTENIECRKKSHFPFVEVLHYQ